MSAIRPVLRSQVLKKFIKRSYHGKSDYKGNTMDDLPVPCGSWKADYDAKNSKYNMHLLIGVASLTATIIAAKASGLVYLNFYPPESPN